MRGLLLRSHWALTVFSARAALFFAEHSRPTLLPENRSQIGFEFILDDSGIFPV